MPRYIANMDGRNEPTIWHFKVGNSQSIKEGDLVQITSGKVEKAVSASTTLVGIAMRDITTTTATDADVIPVILLKSAIIRINYTGTSKSSLSDSDMYGTAFDISDEKTLDLDDTSGGMFKVVGYDNDQKTADVVCAAANMAF